MKAFSLFLTDVNDGATHSALTADLAELIRTVRSTGRAGSLTLKVKVAPAGKGAYVDKVTVVAERKLELPKPEHPSDFFWLDDSDEPTRQHPRQGALDLKPATTAGPLPATALKDATA